MHSSRHTVAACVLTQIAGEEAAVVASAAALSADDEVFAQVRSAYKEFTTTIHKPCIPSVCCDLLLTPRSIESKAC